MICVLARRYRDGVKALQERYGEHMQTHRASTQMADILVGGEVVKAKIVAYNDLIWAEERIKGHTFDEIIEVGKVPEALLNLAKVYLRR